MPDNDVCDCDTCFVERQETARRAALKNNSMRIEYIGVCETCADSDYNVYTLTPYEFLLNSKCDRCKRTNRLDCGLALAMTFIKDYE